MTTGYSAKGKPVVPHPAKPPMIGVLHRDGFPVPSTGYDGWVVRINWADLEPAQGRYDFSVVDTMHHAAQGAKLPVKLRIYGGVAAPVWLKREVGTFNYQHMTDAPAQCPRVWVPAYVQAYAALHAALAAHVDPLPFMRDVTVFGLMGTYAEPFQFLGTSDIPALTKAGYTDQLWHQGMRDCIAAHAAYKRTCCSLALNPVQTLGITATVHTDGGAVGEYATLLRSVLGRRGVLENNSLRVGYGVSGKDAYSAMYSAMVNFGPPICYQTSTLDRLGGSIAAVVQLAAALKGCAVELPAGTTPDPKWRTWLAANAP